MLSSSSFQIHRHHKRTPYASNTFPHESYSWDCDDEALFYYGVPYPNSKSAEINWQVYTSPSNPFAPAGFNGTCQFPQITKGGLDDSRQHGKDLYGVYHTLLNFIPAAFDASKVTYRVTNNVITSQVAAKLSWACIHLLAIHNSKFSSNLTASTRSSQLTPAAPHQTSTHPTALAATMPTGQHT